MLFSSQYLTCFLHVSGVAQFILVTLYARHFVQLCSSSAMSLTRFINSLYFTTPCTITGGGLWILFEHGFPSMESSFVSFVNKPYWLCVSVFVSGGVVLFSVRFLPFCASYHLPFIFAVVLFFFFFLACNVILCSC